MSAFGRAGALSLGLHIAAVAGTCVGLGRGGGRTVLGAPSRSARISQDVGVVMLAAPEVRPAPVQPQIAPPTPLPQPGVAAQPTLPDPPPLPQAIVGILPETDVRPVAHAEPVAVAPAAVASEPPVVARAPGSGTTFFSVAAKGKSVVYVIDRSGSMGGQFGRAREQVIASLRQLPPQARFQVVAYDRNALTLRIGEGGLAAATPTNVELAAEALAAMREEGGTDHVRALKLALQLRPDVIYFLTDEDDLTAVGVRDISNANRGRASIHALCLVAPSGADTPMQVLARQNRGEFRVVAP
jgi:hypothetical protein